VIRRFLKPRIRPGTIIRGTGRYRFMRLLGEGGMGAVWLAEKIGEAGFRKLMAIKMVKDERLKDERALEMFLDEARLVANLVHPNIVQVYQLFKREQAVFVVMEYVFGTSLLDILERAEELGEPVPVDIGTYIAIRIARGLYYAHNKVNPEGQHLGIVHRDVCPSNILVSFRGVPKLTDFGVAKAATSKVDDEGNVVWGKYPYMAPEAVSRKGTDPRSDIYSLGLATFELFTGHLAHEATNTRALKEILAKETRGDRDVRLFRDPFPAPLAEVIIKATDRNPEKRHANAKEFAEDLEQVLLMHMMFPDEERLADYLATLFPEARKHRWY